MSGKPVVSNSEVSPNSLSVSGNGAGGTSNPAPQTRKKVTR
jgi:hypothetical protein